MLYKGKVFMSQKIGLVVENIGGFVSAMERGGGFDGGTLGEVVGKDAVEGSTELHQSQGIGSINQSSGIGRNIQQQQ